MSPGPMVDPCVLNVSMTGLSVLSSLTEQKIVKVFKAQAQSQKAK